MSKQSIMVQSTGFGTGAGKSLLVGLLSYMQKEKGLKVVPFKPLNLTGTTYKQQQKEFGYSQFLQAKAAGIEPDPRTNPLTIKAKGDGLFDLILEGDCIEEDYNPQKAVLSKVLKDLLNLGGREEKIKKRIKKDYKELSEEFDCIIVEGSGPARIFGLGSFTSLLEEATNMGFARETETPVILLSENIDSFPQTLSYMEEEEKDLIKGAIVNKAPINEFLQVGIKQKVMDFALKRIKNIYGEKGGVPILGILPYFESLASLSDLDPIASQEKMEVDDWLKALEKTSEEAEKYLDMEEIRKIIE